MSKLELTQAATMLRLQNDLNAVINPNWLTAGMCFLRAAFVESAEALEHYGWKWWKKQSPDLPQVQIELVDILHFYLSHLLVEEGGSISSAADKIVAALEAPAEEVLDGQRYNLNELDVATLLELIGALSVCRRMSLPVLSAAMKACSLTWQDAFVQYVSKNILNVFRQENGYREGTYIKIWDGEEDNVVLARKMESIDPTRSDYADRLRKMLAMEYSRISRISGS